MIQFNGLVFLGKSKPKAVVKLTPNIEVKPRLKTFPSTNFGHVCKMWSGNTIVLLVQDYCWAKNDTSANKMMGCSDCPVKRDSEYSDWLYPHFCETPISLSSNVSLVNQNRTKQEVSRVPVS